MPPPAVEQAGAAAAASGASVAPAPLPRWPDDGAQLHVAGRSVERASARAKVSGQAVYASDVVRPGMQHAVLVRATIAHGRVVGFDGAAAAAVDGVVAVLGPWSLAWPQRVLRGRPFDRVIGDEVHHAGQEIGVVVAADEATARHAARLVQVAYAPAAACVSVDRALADDAPPVAGAAHPGNLAGGVQVVERGDLAAAEAAAEVVVAADYATEAQHHNCLEPHGCVAAWEGDGLTLWDSNQGPHMIREQLAATLALPTAQVRVVTGAVGGGFGSKIFLRPYHAIAALAARHSGAPVRLFMARREEFVASQQRAPTRRRIRLGATRDGELAFVDEGIVGQAGANPLFAANAAGAANGLRLHRWRAVRAELRRVLTHTPSPVPFRGPTVAEDLFCLEQAVDELAQALGICPLALRLRNLAELDILEGLPYAGKQLERCYRSGAEAFGWRWRAPRQAVAGGVARGIGIGAVAYDGTLHEASTVDAACRRDGRIELRLGVADIGTGCDTVFAQVAAEVLGLPAGHVVTCFGDTAGTPRSIDASNHSRTTAVVGPAVRAAAQALRERLLAAGAARLGCAPEALRLDGDAVAASADRQHRVPLAELAAGGGIVARGERDRPPAGVFAAMFGAHFVEVEVDLGSGRIAVRRAVCAHDAGRLLNPRLAASQVHGGFLQGLAMALHEERLLDEGSGTMLNAAMWAYRTPGVLDAPHELVFVDAGLPDGGNSLGVKGIGEPPLIAAGAAIANAVHNAIGVRMRHYPITPDKVLRALREGSA